MRERGARSRPVVAVVLVAAAAVQVVACRSREQPAPRPAAAAGPSGAIAFSFGGRIHLMRPDGSGRVRVTGGDGHGDPAWSPDGATLAYVRTARSLRSSIHVVDLAGGRSRPLFPAERAQTRDPAWSPDGTRIAFVRDDRTAEEHQLVVAEVDGGGERVLRREPGEPEARALVGEPAWSPDGTRIAYTVTTLDRRHHFRPSLHVVDAEGGEPRLLASDAADPAWSPDGGRIAFSSVRDRNGERCWDQCTYHGELYVMDANGGDPARLTRNRGDDRSPSWSSDGRRIVFASDRNRPQPGGLEIYSIRADGSCLTWLTNGSPESRDPAWRGASPTASDRGRCGPTRRRPLVEVATRGMRRSAYWLGERHGNLLLDAAEVGRDGRSLPTYFLSYDDCARYDPRACPSGMQLQQVSVCSRSGQSTLPVVDDPDYGPLHAFASRGAVFVDIGPGDRSVIVGAAHVRMFGNTHTRRARRRLVQAALALRRVGRPAAPLPAPALPRALLKRVRRTERAHGRRRSIGATARALGIARVVVRHRLELARALRSLPRVRAVDCARR